MSDLPLQREAEAVARSRSLRRFRNAMVVGTSIFLIVVGFVVSALTIRDGVCSCEIKYECDTPRDSAVSFAR